MIDDDMLADADMLTDADTDADDEKLLTGDDNNNDDDCQCLVCTALTLHFVLHLHCHLFRTTCLKHPGNLQKSSIGRQTRAETT